MQAILLCTILAIVDVLLPNCAKPVHCTCERPIEEGHATATVAVIATHGWSGGLGDTVGTLRQALKLRGEDVPVYHLLFPHVATPSAAKADGRAWWMSDWRGGDDAEGTTMSSFDVVDDQLKRLSDRKLFPKLRRVVVAGFSAGGQFVSRYVAVGKCPAREDLKVEYVVLGPSTEFWMLPEERWLYGLASRPRYPAACDEKTMRKNLESRFVWRGVGDKDTGGSVLDLSPEAKRQGANRKARQHAFVAYLKEKYPAWAAQTCQKDIPNCGHSLKVWADEDLIEFILTGKRFTTPDQSK